MLNYANLTRCDLHAIRTDL